MSTFNEALVLHKQGRVKEAQAICEAILESNPNHDHSLHLLGIIAYQEKYYQSSADMIVKAIEINPNNSSFYFSLGNSLMGLGQLQNAVASYEKANYLNQSDAHSYSNCGVALQQLMRLDDSIASFDKAISIKPDFAFAHYGRGASLLVLKQLDNAIVSFDMAIRLKPTYVAAHYKRGAALQSLRRWHDASDSYDMAISLNPGHAFAYSNRGYVLQELMELDAAVASYDKAISIKPDVAEFYWNKSLVLLLRGNFDHGWRLYESRYDSKKTGVEKPSSSARAWLGIESLTGKTILLYSEQGLGDTIQFVRYAHLVAGLGARVIAEVHKELVPLLSGLQGVSEWVEKGSRLPTVDFCCSLLSLPLAFKTNLFTIPNSRAYLQARSEKIAEWSAILGAKTKKMRVGLAWSGNAAHQDDHKRSISLSSFLPYLPSQFEYVSLQKDLRNIDRETIAGCSNLKHFGHALADFSDTAALCELMDVVISVDTSIAHMSGALGKATWILLSYVPDWRWLLDRNDSPWYSSAKLYRQDNEMNWDTVFKRVRSDLMRLASSS